MTFVKTSSRRWAAVTGIATAVLMGGLSVACSSTGTTPPTTTTTTTTTPTTTTTTGHHGEHSSGGGGGGAPAPVQTETVAPGTVTNTETDIQTTVATSVETTVATSVETSTVTVMPTHQQNRDFGPGTTGQHG
jgi:hypothetical protein